MVIDKIYENYAYQFHQAGSPSKVTRTVGTMQIPSDMEYNIHDIASLFKKIIHTIPGGILGSLQLFDALRSIFLNIDPSPDMSDAETDTIRARLIALVISSVPSSYRAYLIHSVLGLAAYFGNEAEKARAEWIKNSAGGSEKNPSSELMGFQPLGRVLGPLLLVDLQEQIELHPAASESDQRVSNDSARKMIKKEKCTSNSTKLEQSALLMAGVDRANLVSDIMEMLLKIWKDVVVQFRKLQARGINAMRRQSSKNFRDMDAYFDMVTLQTPEENESFQNFLRGRSLPPNWQGKVVTTRKVRISSRSPASRRRPVSEGSIPTLVDRGTSDESVANRVAPSVKVNTPGGIVDVNSMKSLPDQPLAQSSPSESTEYLGKEHRTQSDIAMDQMAMGTILLPREYGSRSPHHTGSVPPSSPQRDKNRFPVLPPHRPPPRPVTADTDHSSSHTSLRLVSDPLSEVRTSPAQENTFEKPLPTIGDLQYAQHSSTSLKALEDNGKELSVSSASFPIPRFSLATDKEPPKPSDKLHTFNFARPFRKSESRSSLISGSRKTSEGGAESTSSGKESRGSSIRNFAHRFTELSRKRRQEHEKADGPMQILAHINDIDNPKAPQERTDPLAISPKSLSPDRTLITRPTQDVGSVRKVVNRTPSPPKPSTPPQMKETSSAASIGNQPEDSGSPEPVAFNRTSPPTVLKSRSKLITSSEHLQISPSHSRKTSTQHLGIAPTRPLSAYSSESLRRMHFEQDPPIAQYIQSTHKRVLSFDIDASTDQMRATLHDAKRPTDVDLIAPLYRTGTINATMLSEIARLKRLLEQKSADLDSTKRSLDAIRDAREVVTPVNSSFSDGSRTEHPTGFNLLRTGSVKGSLSEEVRLARKERNEWKRRAEWAESRLAAMKTGSQDIKQEKNADEEQK